MLGWIIGGAVVLVAGGITFSYYNRFVTLENRVDNSLSQIDVQLKRRADLIPNLIETVKGIAKHEKEAIQAVSDARKALVSAKDLTNRVQADKQLEGALGRLFAIAENYPNLKADTNFLELQRELVSTEDKVSYSRQFYNDSIMSYNNLCKQFPGVLFASIFSKSPKNYLEIAPQDREPVKVKF